MSKRRKIIIAAVLVGLLAAIFLNPLSLMFMGMVSYMGKVGKEKAALCKPDVYMPFGEALALYCQSFPLLQSHLEMKDSWQIIFSDDQFYGDARLPRIFAREPFVTYVNISLGEARTMYQGGFLEFGYELDFDGAASSPTENVWQLSFHDYGESKHLATIRMDADRRLTPDELLEITKRTTEK